MDLPFEPLDLVAVDAARDVRRRWRVVAYRDLFGRLTIATDWGRIGTRGQARVRSFDDEADARRHVRALLARRRSAPGRIGVAYLPVALSPRLHIDM